MAELRLVEHYASVQGEGPRTGMLTQFIRFAGCNMRCPGWPCDTEHAIEPSIFLKNSDKMSPEAILAKVVEQPGSNICLTGGEPFIQPKDQLQQLVELLVAEDYKVECFTNGSVKFPLWAMQNMSFMMDWKLDGSGEGDSFVDERYFNAGRLRSHDGIKFVVANLGEDLVEAIAAYEYLISEYDVPAQFWIAPAWDKIHPQELVKLLLQLNLPWRLNLQTHKYIWPAEMQGV